MERRMFEQLNALEQGARIETRPAYDAYTNSSADFSAYGGHASFYDTGEVGEQDHRYEQEVFEDQPMILGSFDEELLHQAEHPSHYDEATRGSTRLSFAPTHRHEHYGPLMPQVPAYARPHAMDLSRFALEAGHDTASGSSPLNRQLLSSPGFRASQRRPAPVVQRSQSQVPLFEDIPTETRRSSRYQTSNTHEPESNEYDAMLPQMERGCPSQPICRSQQARLRPAGVETGLPVVQGISLVSTRALPDRFRAIFPYPLFNAVQSKTFDTVYKGNDNLVLAAPTGSGKTAVLELAICRLINGFASGSYKIVYQAPTKSLCSERQRDWQAKFGPLDLQCAELTGDTDSAQHRNVQYATIIITTPEKWDSMTRKWKDHERLMQMVKLFLIDEVHILKEDRGATLEAVVSRMKSVGSDVRFVALSATVPNSQDIATWLGKDPVSPHLPAVRERFGEEFRPVRLQKHVVGYQANSNDFAFEKTLSAKLPDVIAKWSQRKPMMVFCFTRNACVETAKLLANWWSTKSVRERYWGSPRKRIIVAEKDLQDLISCGIAFHHAGLSPQDRMAVEEGYLEGNINVICCTSTLAVGVNLPCHMVVIKNTVSYQNNAAGGCKEYSDLEIMQMLGRAGRPQFDDSAIAVIMTRQQRVPFYEKMISGQEVLESCLHRNLIDHLNAEIGLGTITSVSSAKKWLSGTFLYVRLKHNPEHYKIQGDLPGRNLDERLENICSKGITVLEENDLVTSSPKLHCTDFGDAMARYYLQFDTMKGFLALPPKAKVSEILSSISHAAEFRDVRFRGGEKSSYKDLNKNGSIKFPIPVNLDAPAHKVSLVIQSVLGAIELPTEDHKQRIGYNTAKAVIFQHVHRLIRCIIDCQLYLNDAVATKNALMLGRSLGAQVWDDSLLHMKQLEGVGLVSVRKLVAAGITSIEDLELTEAHRIETALSRNPPFGSLLQQKARTFPKLRVSIKEMGEPSIMKGEHVSVRLKAELGFLNDKVPDFFNKKPVYVCLLAETSDGHKIHFARTSAKKLNKGQDVLFTANLTDANQSVRAYVMCDEIAGTMRYANIKPDIPPHAFPPRKKVQEAIPNKTPASQVANIPKRRVIEGVERGVIDDASDDFGDDCIEDIDLTLAETGGFMDIDNFGEADNDPSVPKSKKRKTTNDTSSKSDWQPQQLASGKWACNHACKDKTACKHLCCREGLDKKPNAPKSMRGDKKRRELSSEPKQTQISMPQAKHTKISTKAVADSPGLTQRASTQAVESNESRDLNRLHNSIKTTAPDVPIIRSGRVHNMGKPTAQADDTWSSGYPAATFDLESEERISSDFGLDDSDLLDLPDVTHATTEVPSPGTSTYRGPKRPRQPSETGLSTSDVHAGVSHFQQPRVEIHRNNDAGLTSSTGYEILEKIVARSRNITPNPVTTGNKDHQRNGNTFLISSSESTVEDLTEEHTSAVNEQTHVGPKTSLGALNYLSLPNVQESTSTTAAIGHHRTLSTAGQGWRNEHDAPYIPAKVEPVASEPVIRDAEHANDLETWFFSEFDPELFNFVG